METALKFLRTSDTSGTLVGMRTLLTTLILPLALTACGSEKEAVVPEPVAVPVHVESEPCRKAGATVLGDAESAATATSASEVPLDLVEAGIERLECSPDALAGFEDVRLEVARLHSHWAACSFLTLCPSSADQVVSLRESIRATEELLDRME